MATITLRAQKGAPLTFAEVDNNFSAINAELAALGLAAALKGSITNADIAGNAAIADTKLATISTAGKVANSATTATASNTPSAIVQRDGSGDFAARIITASLAGNANTATQFSGNRTIALTGAVSGTVSSSFSGNVSLQTTLAAGVVTDVSISANAAIADSKLATIESANKVGASAIDVDGAFDIGQPLSDTALLLVDRTGAGENRKASVTRIPAYVFSKVSGDVTISSDGVATVTPAGKIDPADVFAQVSGDLTISPTGTAALSPGAIYNADINDSAAIAHTKLAALIAGNVLLGNSANIPTGTPISGDISLSSAGVALLNAGVVKNTNVASDAGIAFSKLAALPAGQLLMGNNANQPAGVGITGDVTINGSGVTAIKANVALAGDPTSATPDVASNSGRLATTGYVVTRIAQDAPSRTGANASGNWNINILGSSNSCSGNAASATRLATPRAINGVSFDGSTAITITANTPNSVTFGSTNGAVSGSAFNGGSSLTVSYNTIGAAAASHTHGNITNAGAIGTVADRPVITGPQGVLTTGAFGTAAGTFCEGNDSRLASLASGVFTPTTEGPSNATIASVTGFYQRFGTIVAASLRVAITATTAGSFQFDASLPILRSTGFTDELEATGHGIDRDRQAAVRVAAVTGSTSRIRVTGNAAASGAAVIPVSFMYDLA